MGLWLSKPLAKTDDDGWVKVPSVEEILDSCIGKPDAAIATVRITAWRALAYCHEGVRKVLTTSIRPRHVAFVAVAVVLAVLAVLMSHATPRPKFNPFEELGITEGASPKQIRSAFRKMSLLFSQVGRPEEGQIDRFHRMQMALDVLWKSDSCRADYTQSVCWRDLPPRPTLRTLGHEPPYKLVPWGS